MDQIDSLIGWVSPAWILVIALGALWAGIVAVAFPPPIDRFPRVLAGAVLGAALGQLVGGTLAHPWLMVGDVHVVSTSLGSVLALGIVRRLAA